jgi:hypothetical protein
VLAGARLAGLPPLSALLSGSPAQFAAFLVFLIGVAFAAFLWWLAARSFAFCATRAPRRSSWRACANCPSPSRKAPSARCWR